MSLSQVNAVLWKCSSEELEGSAGCRNVYKVPGFGEFAYAGLGALAGEFKRMGVFNQLGHAIFNNIRAGNWLIDYHCERLQALALPAAFTAFCLAGLGSIKQIPRGSIPKHIVKFVLGLFHMVKFYTRTELFRQSSALQSIDDSFINALAFATTQFYGSVKSAETSLLQETVAAGLPHFAVGLARCWGRQTFIAFKGMFLRTGRYQEAEDTLALYASTMQHGLIPNLLGQGRSCRYNSRDTTWWFLQAFKDYFLSAPNSQSLLSRSIKMQFQPCNLTFASIIHSILQSHAQGIAFREYNAGPQLDSHMQSEGFNVQITTDPVTGFISGGNQWNCGTWMDSMGTSAKAGNRGISATPRDGADVEIVGLLYSVVSFLGNAAEQRKFPFAEVTFGNGEIVSYEQWGKRVKNSFEPYFWIPETGPSPHVVESCVHTKGIYKDVLGSSDPNVDYMFRPNQCIAMAVAPDLFDHEHALVALRKIDIGLLGDIVDGGQLGVKTLSPDESLYRPFYTGTEDSEEHTLANGFSSHNGPEYIWLLGFVLTAKLHFQQSPTSHIMQHTVSLRKHITTSHWLSLPELTNLKGSFCKDSTPAQASSIATLLDSLLGLSQLRGDLS